MAQRGSSEVAIVAIGGIFANATVYMIGMIAILAPPPARASDISVEQVIQASTLVESIKAKRSSLEKLEKLDESAPLSVHSLKPSPCPNFVTTFGGSAYYSSCDCERSGMVSIRRSALIAAVNAELEADAAKLRALGVK